MNVTLQLRYHPTPLRPVAAWLVPGTDPRAWLAEMTAWNVPLAEARIVITPAGALVMLEGGSEPAGTTAAAAYGQIAGRLYLPVEGRLDPPLADAELAELLAGDEALYVWHPAAGLLRFDESQAIPVARLVAAPPPGNRAWDAAQPGVAVNQRLLSIEPTERLTMEDVLEAGRCDIGSQPLDGHVLPQAPGEPAGGAVGRAIAGASLATGAAVAGGLAAAVDAFAAGMAGLSGPRRKAPVGNATSNRRGAAGGGPNWLQRLAQWAQERKRSLGTRLDRLRNQQIERLLHALASSPDEGLRYALPLANTGARQGFPRGNRLPERDVNFDLGRLGGGQPVDHWDLPPEYRQKLATRYRELANREISLGRHRRAAYILAELLGDLSAAAATLADGGHFREAAVLYQERLHQPRAAAQCLERGGLLAEAISLFESLEEWEAVGDLYQRLSQDEPATSAYRRAVMRCMAAGDRLAAARLLETKLADVDQAGEVLLESWPETPQAQLCLDESFELFSRHRLHQRAHAAIERLRSATVMQPMLAPLAAGLAKVVTRYSDDNVRQAAAETIRQVVAQRLPVAAESETQSLLGSLASLVPSDRLLPGDCRRFQDRREQSRPRARPRGSRDKLPRPVSWFHLPRGTWMAAASGGDEFYAAGLFRSWLVLVRGRWDGALQILTGEPWLVPPELQSQPILLAADPRGLSQLYVHVAEGCPRQNRTFAASGHFPGSLVAGPHAGCTRFTEAMCYGPAGSLHLLEVQPPEHLPEIACYGGPSRLEGKRSFTLSPEMFDQDQIVRPLPFYVGVNAFYLAVGTSLISLRAGQEATTLHAPIRSIAGSAWHSRSRIVAACSRGGVVLWGPTANCPASSFGMELAEPVVGLARGGWLVAATSDALEVSGTQGGRLTWIGQVPGPGQPPLAVLPTSDPNQFALLTSDGRVTIYQVRP